MRPRQFRPWLASLTPIAATLSIVVSAHADTETWSGSTNGTWDTATDNWLTDGSNNVFESGDDALFTGTPTNNVTAATGLNVGAITLDSSFTGTVTMSGANTVSGTTTIDGGTLQMGAGGTIGTIGSAAIVNNSVLAFNYGSGANLTISNSISGSGSVTLTAASGTPRVHFNGTNTYSGSTTIGAGVTLEVNAASAASANSDYMIDGAMESYNGIASVTIGALNGSGIIYNTGSSGGTTTFTVGANGHSGNFSGVIRNGAWGSRITALTKTGAGTQTLSGANIYTGATKVTAGTLAVTTGGVINNTVGGFEVGNTANTNAVLAITGGSVTDSNTGGNAWGSLMNVGLGSFGRGFVNLTSGTLNARRQLFLGNSNGSADGAYGAMTMSNGELNVGSYFGIGFNTNTYGVFNQTGGTVIQNQTSGAGSVLLGSGTGAFGVANLSGGSFTANGGIYVAENGAATGTLTVSESADVTAGNVGVKFGNNSGASNGIVNLLGGTLTTNIVQRGNGTATFNFNGGTLKASGDHPNFMTGLNNAYVHSGGGTIDNNGHAITIGQALVAPSGSGVSASGLAITGGSGYIDTPVVVISGGGGTGATAVANVSGGVVTGITITNPGVGYTSVPTFTLFGGGGSGAAIDAGTAAVVANPSGGMTFSGAGTTTLNGVNTYAGTTTVTEGSLALGSGASIANSTEIALNGGNFNVSAVSGFSIGTSQTLTGDGGSISGDIIVNGTLAIGNSPGTMGFNDDLTFGETSISNFDIMDITFASGTYDLAQGGDGTQQVTFGGTLNLFFSGGTYTNNTSVQIFDFESYDGDFATVNSSGLGEGQSAFFNAATGSITIVPEPDVSLLGGLGLLALLRRRRA